MPKQRPDICFGYPIRIITNCEMGLDLFGQQPLPLRNCGRHAMPVDNNTCPLCDRSLDVQHPNIVALDDNGDEVCCHRICTWQCDHCDTHYLGDVMTSSYPYATICVNCYGSEYTSCDNCADEFNTENSFSTDDNGDDCLCHRCYDIQRTMRKSLHAYSYKPKPIFVTASGEYASTDTTPFFGVELEVSQDDENENTNDFLEDIVDVGLDSHKNFYCKEDSSIDAGFEIVSHPMTYNRWLEENLEFMPKLERKGYMSHTSCGMHVHVSEKFVSKLTLYRLLHFFKKNEQFVYALGQRTSPDYCEVCTYDDKELLDLARAKNTGRGAIYARKSAKTVEFRIFRGQVDPKIIKLNIAIVVALIGYAKKVRRKHLSIVSFIAFIEKEGNSFLKEQVDPVHRWVTKVAKRFVTAGDIANA